VQELDGYTALRALLPPPERRALVLIDPPYEAQDEFEQVLAGVGEGLSRFPSGTFALWYPLTYRARVDEFFDRLRQLPLPPTWVVELSVAGEGRGPKMRGCGLVVINPPWRLDEETRPWLPALAALLAQADGATAHLTWLVPETP
jgi:23S rRNA (adenine2030-N6)-methyltransferase